MTTSLKTESPAKTGVDARRVTQANGVAVNANKGDQFTSFDVDAFELPTHKDEVWRFTPLKRLRGLHDGSVKAATGSAALDIPSVEGMSVETVGLDDKRIGAAGAPRDRVAALAFSASKAATIVTVGSEVELAEPVLISMTGPGSDKFAFSHLQLRVQHHGKASIVLDQRGSGTLAENIEFIVEDSAQLEVVVIQDWEDDVVHVAGHHLSVGRDATLRHTAVSIGGEIVRLTPVATFTGQGGSVEMFGLYFADDGQHLEQRLLVDHSVANCRSNVLYKGALQGDPTSDKPDAHTVWVGDVLIRAEAENTDTFEMNRNLLLTDGARADSVPNLEIETGEIAGAGHASATGRFDDEQLFYLLSRGIPEDQARRLVIRGFFGEVIAKIGIAEIRDRLTETVEAELERSGA